MNITIGKDIGSYTFNATGQTITFSGVGDVTLTDILLITNVTNNIIIYNFAELGGTLSNNVLSLDYDTTLMSGDDVIRIDFDNGYPYIDFGLSVLKTINQSPLWNRYTDFETFVTAQNLTTGYTNIGSEIDMRGYNELTIYLKAVCNNSLTVLLKVLGKYESVGSDEFEIDGISVKTLWSGTGTDFNKIYNIRIPSIPFLQLQAIAAIVGTISGNLTIYISKSWKPI